MGGQLDPGLQANARGDGREIFRARQRDESDHRVHGGADLDRRRQVEADRRVAGVSRGMAASDDTQR